MTRDPARSIDEVRRRPVAVGIDATDPHMSGDDEAVVMALRAGDERIFVDLVQRYQRPLLRLAQTFVPSQAVAEEVVQDTWIAVIKGIDRFEGRSSLRTWVFRILTYQAKSRGERERRSIPLSAFLPAGAGADEPAVDPSRFRPQRFSVAGSLAGSAGRLGI